jgi:tRNA pseudouridine55 synthase
MKDNEISVNGFISVIKPKGWTSNQVLSKIKWLFKTKKAGHGGTLDPFATGVIPVFLGEATKFSSRILDADKEYIANIKLGYESTTGDLEGDVNKDDSFNYEELPANIDNLIKNQFLGKQTQIPPKYSALKYKGKPYYKYARAGIEIPIKSREIEIKEIVVISQIHNQLMVQVSCSKGTYIRTLGEDIAKILGTKGYLTDLKRVRVGDIYEKDSFLLEDIENKELDQRYQLLRPIEKYIDLPEIILDQEQTLKILQGQFVEINRDSGDYILRGSDNTFIGLGILIEDELRPLRLIKN